MHWDFLIDGHAIWGFWATFVSWASRRSRLPDIPKYLNPEHPRKEKSIRISNLIWGSLGARVFADFRDIYVSAYGQRANGKGSHCWKGRASVKAKSACTPHWGFTPKPTDSAVSRKMWGLAKPAQGFQDLVPSRDLSIE